MHYHSLFRINEASDAYSFGKVVLEMICGKLSDLNDRYSDMFEDSESETEYSIDLLAFEKVIE